MEEKVVPAKLLAVKEDNYTTYVFKNTDNNEYVMCTRLPNWEVPTLYVGDEGFLQFQMVTAGDIYFNATFEQSKSYLYSNVYFKNFIKKSEIIL